MEYTKKDISDTKLSLNTIYNMDCLEGMKLLADNSVDAIVTDPPYGLSFMGKKRDYDVPSQEIREEALRVLKPGGYLLSFAGTRTQHRMAVRIEDAGFEIRDMIAWVYGSGFPKSLNIGKAIDKRGGNVLLTKEIGDVLRIAREKRGTTKSQADDKYCGGTTNWSWFEGRQDGQRIPPSNILELVSKDREELKYYVDIVKEAEREVIGEHPSIKGNGSVFNVEFTNGTPMITAPATEQAKQREGRGTALKPTLESITLAQKGFDFRSVLDILIKDNLYILKKELCQFPLCVGIAEKHLQSNKQEQGGEHQSIVEWIAEKNINIQVDLPVVIDMLQCLSTENTNLNIVLGWLNILVDLYTQANTYTTETKISLTTDLIILNSYEYESIYQSIIQVKNNQTNELSADVYNVEILFKGLQLKLKTIQEHFAQECAISKVATNSLEGVGLTPNLSPIIMSRKPIEGTVAENCLKWGVGGINIDGCRVGTGDRRMCGTTKKSGETNYVLGAREETRTEIGRFPANLIHDGSDEVVGLFPNSKSTPFNAKKPNNPKTSWKMTSQEYAPSGGFADNGSASRFFYCAKASKRERNMGCEGLETSKKFTAGNYSQSPTCKTCDLTLNGTNDHSECSGEVYYKEMESKNTKNNHPTVKPIALMEYLVKLVSREDAVVLDPFTGSGSTLIACKKLKRQYIGFELDEDYITIAEARLQSIKSENSLFS